MITNWKLYNFKSVKRETDLEFAPLTIFAGANSSGKSTFLQSILLVAQTLAHKVSSRSVVLNGALARLGQFDDLKSVDSDADQIVIGWKCRPLQNLSKYGAASFRRMPYSLTRGKQRLATVSCEIAFDAIDSEAQREIVQIQPLLFSSQLSATTRDPDTGDHRYSFTIRRASSKVGASKRKWIDAANIDEPFARLSLQYDVEMDEESLADIREELISAQPVGCILRHFLPGSIALGVDMVAEETEAILYVITGDGSRGYLKHFYMDREITVPRRVIDFILEFVRDMEDGSNDIHLALSQDLETEPNLFGDQPITLEQLHKALRRVSLRRRTKIQRKISEDEQFKTFVKDSIRKARKDQDEEPAVIPFRPPTQIANASRFLDQFFGNSVRYLGPLRDEPKSLYPLSPTADPSDVGLKGEHTAAVLDLHKNRQIQYIPTSSFAEPEIVNRPVTRSLEKAVIDWLRYLGVAENVESRDKGKFGHELTVSITESKIFHDLTHVGVGVSQVLPILVVSLLAEPDTTLIFEQPELHLHPNLSLRNNRILIK